MRENSFAICTQVGYRIFPMILKEHIRSLGLSIEQYADRIDRSAHTVGKWVRGERIPRPEAQELLREDSGGNVTSSDLVRQHIEWKAKQAARRRPVKKAEAA